MTRLLPLLIILALADSAGAASKVPTTRLLFRHVTNANGFDTSIVIANTSLDPFGTTPESGACRLDFFGTNPPETPFTTAVIPAGAVDAELVSLVAPGFDGYLFVECNFNHAHGITFVSDIGARNIAHGEAALVIPTKKRPAKNETLGH